MISVDASVAAKWLFPEEYSEQALSLVHQATATNWTSDERLLRLLAGKLSYVRWIADFSA